LLADALGDESIPYCWRRKMKRRRKKKGERKRKKKVVALSRSLPLCPSASLPRGGGLGSRPKKMYGGRLGAGVEYHFQEI